MLDLYAVYTDENSLKNGMVWLTFESTDSFPVTVSDGDYSRDYDDEYGLYSYEIRASRKDSVLTKADLKALTDTYVLNNGQSRRKGFKFSHWKDTVTGKKVTEIWT